MGVTRGVSVYLLLKAMCVGMTLLVKWHQKLSSQYEKGDLGNPPPTWSMVGTNLTDIVAHRKITIRELGGCLGPIWSSYYGNCRSLLVGDTFELLGKFVPISVLSSPRAHFV